MPSPTCAACLVLGPAASRACRGYHKQRAAPSCLRISRVRLERPAGVHGPARRPGIAGEVGSASFPLQTFARDAGPQLDEARHWGAARVRDNFGHGTTVRLHFHKTGRFDIATARVRPLPWTLPPEVTDRIMRCADKSRDCMPPWQQKTYYGRRTQ